MEDMTETHRHLLQFMMKQLYCEKSVIEEQLNKYKQLYKYDQVQAYLRQQQQQSASQQQQQSTATINDRTLADFLRTINAATSFMHFNIKSMKHPKTGIIYYGLVNELDDEISKQATEFNPHEIAMFRKILEHLIACEEDESDATVMDLLNLRDKITLTEANAFVSRLESEGWLQKVQGGIWFGPRTLLDLRGYMTDQFNYDPLG